MRIKLFAFAAAAAAAGADAAPLLPEAVGLIDGAGRAVAPSAGPFSDDVFLSRLVFPGAIFETTDSFRPAASVEILVGRANVNAEWGDDDDGGDGHDSPFARAGLDPSLQETVDPAAQEAGLLSAFNSLSLTEMSDGESGAMMMRVLFEAGLTDDRPGEADGAPELLFLERGMNDRFRVEAIIGGAPDAPTLSAPVDLDSADFWDSGVAVDTVEIDQAQSIGIAGLDLDAFALEAGSAIFGFVLTVLDGGPDLNGFFLSSEAPERFEAPLDPKLARDPEGPRAAPLPAFPEPGPTAPDGSFDPSAPSAPPVAVVPLPPSAWLLGAALLLMARLGRRARAA